MSLQLFCPIKLYKAWRQAGGKNQKNLKREIFKTTNSKKYIGRGWESNIVQQTKKPSMIAVYLVDKQNHVCGTLKWFYKGPKGTSLRYHNDV